MIIEVMCDGEYETCGRSRWEYGFQATSGVGEVCATELRLRGSAPRCPERTKPQVQPKRGLFEMGKRYKVEITEIE